MLRKLLIPGIISGVIAGAVLSLVQLFYVIPLILDAETYEVQSSQHSHAPTSNNESHQHSDETSTSSVEIAPEWAPEDGNERSLFTLMTNILLGLGFSLLVISLMTATGHNGWQSGLFWGLAGFCVFYLAPSLGLPPELPGSIQATLENRQLWWTATVISTALGLGLLFLNPAATFKILGVLFIIAPHFFIGTVSIEATSPVPKDLEHSFIIATSFANILFWAILGLLNGVLKSRYSKSKTVHEVLS